MDKTKPNIITNASVLIKSGKIDRIYRSGNFKLDKTTQVIRGEGKSLMPALSDMHVHIWDEAELASYLIYGVSNIRNASGMPFHLELQEKVNNGIIDGPRLFTTGPILNGTGPNTQINHQIVNTAEDAKLAVRTQYKQGFKHLKLYSNLSRESFEAILSEAKKLNMSIMGHSPEGIREKGIPYKNEFKISFLEVLDKNFLTIEHIETIVWHALYDKFDTEKVRELAKKIAKKNVSITASLISHHNLVRVAETEGRYLKRADVDLLNPFIVENEQETYRYWSSKKKNSRKKFDAFYQKATKIFHEEGVKILAGTDAGIFTNIPGKSLIHELELLISAGLTNYEALETATVNAAKVLNTDSGIRCKARKEISR